MGSREHEIVIDGMIAFLILDGVGNSALAFLHRERYRFFHAKGVHTLQEGIRAWRLMG